MRRRMRGAIHASTGIIVFLVLVAVVVFLLVTNHLGFSVR